MNLRERCEKLEYDMDHTDTWGERTRKLEAFAREIRNEALEEAARKLEDYEGCMCKECLRDQMGDLQDIAAHRASSAKEQG